MKGSRSSSTTTTTSQMMNDHQYLSFQQYAYNLLNDYWKIRSYILKS